MNNLKLTRKKGKNKTLIRIDSKVIGENFIIIAGPCSVESEKQILEIAKAVKNSGADILRGGAFKPRTSPYSFQGLGLEGLKILNKVKKIIKLPVITEVLDPRDVSWVSEFVDILQIGTRNMQNYALLKEVGLSDKPVMLKRSMNGTIKEWLYSAEYILDAGNPNVILCERGIRTFENYTRNTLDLSAVVAVKQLSHLPVIVDPSHATGNVKLIPSLIYASYAAGADGVMVEVHNRPEKALSDGAQSLTPKQFELIVSKLEELKNCRIKNGKACISVKNKKSNVH